MRRSGMMAVACTIAAGLSSAALAQSAPSTALAQSAPSTALAQSAPGDVAATRPDDAEQPPRVGYGAMPGGLHVATAAISPPGTIELAALSGVGYRKGLLGAEHTLERASGELAVAYTPLRHLVLGLSLDGRYDKHDGLPAMTGNGYTGDPHVLARYAAPIGRIAVGGQLGVWIPGKREALSLSASATTVDARGLLSWTTGFGTLSFDAGARIDNTAKLVGNAAALSVEHRVSLGVSDYHAALAGIQLAIPVGERWCVALEGSTEVFVGSGAPGPIVRAGGMLGVALGAGFTITGYLEVAKVPGLDYSEVMAGNVVLIPYEPTITTGLGLQVRFGGARRGSPPPPIDSERSRSVTAIATADVSGVVVDDSGKPITGARITIRLKHHTGATVTDDRGAYSVARLPIGRIVQGKTEFDDTVAELSAEVARRKPTSATLTLARGANVAPTLTLDPLLPPGQLRVLIINLGTSRPVGGATVTLEPGGATATTGADGKLTIDVAPGRYQLTVTAKGLAAQQLDVNIEQDGVAIKNIELHK